MKISYISYKNKPNYISKILGIDTFIIYEPEEIDSKISELRNENYTTVIMSNELASFSTDIIKKYKNDSSFNIIITP